MSKPRPAKPDEGAFWITGASSGIGRAVALEAVRQGWRVIATSRRADELEALRRYSSDPSRLIAAPADVTEAGALRAAIAPHGTIARAFLNAGLFLPTGLPFEPEKYHRSFAVNLGGVVNSLDCVLPLMERRKSGQIALNASVAGYTGLPTSAAYGATKAGLINLAESLKFDCDRAGVLLQLVNPGFVDTPATSKNPFPMPFLMPVETAALRVMRGLDTSAFEITFPRRFAYILKFLAMLPYGAYFPLVARATGWKK